MADVVGIRFKSCGRIYDFDPAGIEVSPGDRVIVESEFGLSIGTVVTARRAVEGVERDIKKILRIATDEDLGQKKENENFEREAKRFCLERIMARGLPMKLVCSEVTLDRKRIVFYFTADGRIDFRELVKDLAAKFRTRIEMRQIGVRDKAKLVGGLGLCGKELCCRLFLTSFEPISIKMAKQQELVLNTGKLSGICGRLMCCLGYEYNEGSLQQAPVVGDTARPGGPEEEPARSPGDEPAGKPDAVCCTVEPSGQDARPSGSPGAEQKKPEKSGRPRRRRRHKKRYTQE
jgi:cell fate regulator YaaT (PSP1 superfamily)